MGILGTKTMSGNWSASYSLELLKSLTNQNEIDLIWYLFDISSIVFSVWFKKRMYYLLGMLVMLDMLMMLAFIQLQLVIIFFLLSIFFFLYVNELSF